MPGAQLLLWHNLFFALPILAALVTLVVSALTGLGHEAGGAGTGDADADSDLPAEGDYEAEPSGVLLQALSLFGLGRVPLSILLTCCLLIFGVAGLSSNLLLAGTRLPPVVYFWISLGLALVACLLLTGRIAVLVARYLPALETVRVTRQDLVGRTGRAVYRVDEKSGTVDVKDAHGNLHRIAGRTAGGTVSAGREVVIERYLPEENCFIVSELNL